MQCTLRILIDLLITKSSPQLKIFLKQERVVLPENLRNCDTVYKNASSRMAAFTMTAPGPTGITRKRKREETPKLLLPVTRVSLQKRRRSNLVPQLTSTPVLVNRSPSERATRAARRATIKNDSVELQMLSYTHSRRSSSDGRVQKRKPKGVSNPSESLMKYTKAQLCEMQLQLQTDLKSKINIVQQLEENLAETRQHDGLNEEHIKELERQIAEMNTVISINQKFLERSDDRDLHTPVSAPDDDDTFEDAPMYQGDMSKDDYYDDQPTNYDDHPSYSDDGNDSHMDTREPTNFSAVKDQHTQLPLASVNRPYSRKDDGYSSQPASSNENTITTTFVTTRTMQQALDPPEMQNFRNNSDIGLQIQPSNKHFAVQTDVPCGVSILVQAAPQYKDAGWQAAPGLDNVQVQTDISIESMIDEVACPLRSNILDLSLNKAQIERRLLQASRTEDHLSTRIDDYIGSIKSLQSEVDRLNTIKFSVDSLLSHYGRATQEDLVACVTELIEFTESIQESLDHTTDENMRLTEADERIKSALISVTRVLLNDETLSSTVLEVGVEYLTPQLLGRVNELKHQVQALQINLEGILTCAPKTIAALRKELEEHQQDFEQITTLYASGIGNIRRQLAEEMNSFKTKSILLEDTVDRQEKIIERLESELESSHLSQRVLIDDQEALTRELEKLKKSLQSVSEELVQKNFKIENLNRVVEEAGTETLILHNVVSEARKQVEHKDQFWGSRMADELEIFKNEKEDLEERLENASNDVKLKFSRIQDLETALEKVEVEKSALQEHIRHLATIHVKELATKQEEINAAKLRIAELELALREDEEEHAEVMQGLQDELEQLQVERDGLTQEAHSEKASYEARIIHLEANIEHVRSTYRDTEKDLQTEVSSLKESMAKNEDIFKGAFERLKGEFEAQTTDWLAKLKILERNRRAEKKAADNTKEDMLMQLNLSHEDNQRLTREVERLQRELETAQTHEKQLSLDLSKKQGEIEHVKRQMTYLEQSFLAERERLEGVIADLELRICNLDSHKQELSSSYQEINERLQKVSREKKIIDMNLEKVLTHYRTIHSEYNKLSREHKEAQGSVETVRHKLEQVQTTMKTLFPVKTQITDTNIGLANFPGGTPQLTRVRERYDSGAIFDEEEEATNHCTSTTSFFET
ncbi:hypothetical protein NEOLI_000120 [Neolecta irregularis DAH-3]|uniref:Uncharacterized protein n=1 Tax=Neolecta irregularis (strain DAH-3) TaxID=1198029 RepID=A0A1U7LQU4_NEOID|nr:hypothetical protein NEOLI_000120 [Neolecta irregularis DAH-3]|eukprot:OLL25014.1 hypothetical protein NEOLI_000120 [Neolecta irregularis DAH-3]